MRILYENFQEKGLENDSCLVKEEIFFSEILKILRTNHNCKTLISYVSTKLLIIFTAD